jgi:hypothetical protein
MYQRVPLCGTVPYSFLLAGGSAVKFSYRTAPPPPPTPTSYIMRCEHTNWLKQD